MKQRPLPLRVLSAGLACAVLSTSAGFAFAAPAIAADELTTIAAIQGSGSETPLKGTTVTTRGVVTASYPTGGLKGFIIQTEGTGQNNKTADASDAIFVYMNAQTDYPNIGQFVEVTGTAGEHYNLTQITAPTIKVLEGVAFSAPQPLDLAWPAGDTEREAFESMLVKPTSNTYTVSDTYNINKFGEVVLAFGDTPLLQPTDVARPSTPEATAVTADNEARKISLDDGSSTNFGSSSNNSLTPPYISTENPVRVGAPVVFDEAVIVDYRNSAWKLNPTRFTAAGDEAVSFVNTRTPAPSTENIGDSDFTVASFNVLNYFTTGGNSTCTFYKDRTGAPITVNSCPDNGPRGAWDETNLKRQQDKLVAAINSTDASVIGLMEIENSAALGEEADEATETLVTALNAAAGTEKWAYVPSSTDLPVVSEQDVITNAIIYQKNEVALVGSPRALGDLSSEGEPFNNAREPLGQAFKPAGDGEPFFIAVNHFKSKGSGTLPGDADAGDGQGASNASRVAQANALVAWIPTALEQIKVETGTEIDAVALLGDFNSYTEEDPMHVFYTAGYKNAVKEAGHGEYTYSYSNLAGSLDHVVYNEAFGTRVTGADVWEINSGEALLLEYSRYNYQGQPFYAPDAYRSSDHDPVVVGMRTYEPDLTTLNFLDINDFHGRIEANKTVQFAGTVEGLRAEAGEDKTLFLSAGDNIGASLFESAIAQDKPTIDVLNALDLAVTTVGNHEFDQGLADLEGRVQDESDFNHLGANVYVKGTKRPVLDEFEIFNVDGVRVGVIGAVTEETPSLVTPAGISEIEFGNPVEAVNRVAEKLTDGKVKNGEADVLVALYHDGANDNEKDATLAQEIAAGGSFAEIATETHPMVAAIFTGHTHKQYAWMADNGKLADRPIVQTGSYGEFIGQAKVTFDRANKEVSSATARNVARVTTAPAELISAYPRVAEVDTIVKAALAFAAEQGNVIVGSTTAAIKRATSGDGAGFVDGIWTGGKDDAREEASALGNLVADALLDTLKSADRGGAEISVVNPGGMRSNLPSGDITYAAANGVLPFLNNLSTTQLTGAQFKVMLEQQWQTNPGGPAPSRPFLQLTLSDNVSYTYNAANDHGSKITSITVNGAPIVLDKLYTIGTFSFLAAGGDNFRVFAEGTNTRDSGLVDRDAWISYLTANPGLVPDFARNGVAVESFPETVKTGDSFTIDLSRIDTFSPGAPQNTLVKAQWEGGKLASPVAAGEVVVKDGVAKLALTVPVTAAGAGKLVIVANGTATTVTLPIEVTAVAPPVVPTKINFTVGKSVAGAKTDLSVTLTGTNTTGKVEFREGTKVLASVPVVGGKAKASVALKAGDHKLVAVFIPTDGEQVKSGTVTLRTAKADAKVSAKLAKTSISYGSTTSVTVTVSAKGVTPTGAVELFNGSKKIGTATLKAGANNTATASIKTGKLNAGKYTFEARYVGSSEVSAAKAKVATLTVKKQKSSTKVKVSNKGRTVTVTVSAGVRPSGKVTVKVNGKTYTKSLKNGKATFKIAKPKLGKQTYKVTYAGSKNTASSVKSLKYTVKR